VAAPSLLTGPKCRFDEIDDAAIRCLTLLESRRRFALEPREVACSEFLVGIATTII
jgi:hypothetical protein